MNLHEYQGKELLSKFGVNIQRGIVVKNLSEALEAGKKIAIVGSGPSGLACAQQLARAGARRRTTWLVTFSSL